MLEGLFLVAVLLGGMAACHGSPTAIALLLGTALQNALTLCGVPFIPELWVVIGACEIVAIWTWRSSPRDVFVIALFVPEWLSYFLDGMPGYAVSVFACSAQFLLSVPWEHLWRGLRNRSRPVARRDDLDLRVLAAIPCG